MFKNLIVLMALVLVNSVSGPAIAQENISAVQAAAAAKLVDRLGKLRGAVAPDDKSVFLTEDMVESRLPQRLRSNIAPEHQSIEEKPKLPPIVWKILPKMDQMIDNIMTGTTRPPAPKKQSKPESIPPNLNLV